MRKKLSLLLALVMICATMLTACGKKAADITGTTWSLETMETGGVEYTGEQISALGLTISCEFQKDGVLVSEMFPGDTSATWKQDGNTITLTSNGESVEGTIDGDKLTIDQDGSKAVFKKN